MTEYRCMFTERELRVLIKSLSVFTAVPAKFLDVDSRHFLEALEAKLQFLLLDEVDSGASVSDQDFFPEVDYE